jgi:hypothetical protein
MHSLSSASNLHTVHRTAGQIYCNVTSKQWFSCHSRFRAEKELGTGAQAMHLQIYCDVDHDSPKRRLNICLELIDDKLSHDNKDTVLQIYRSCVAFRQFILETETFSLAQILHL